MLEIERGKIEKENIIKQRIDDIFDSYKVTLEKKSKNQNKILD